MALAAEQMLDETRHRLNQLFGGKAPERWVLTLNCTDGLNLAIKGLLQPGDHVVTTDLEHNSVSRPLRALEKMGVISLTRVASAQGYVDAKAIQAAIGQKTKLVVMTHASNVLGTVQPIEAIAPHVRAAGTLFLVDAAQSAGVVPINLNELPINLLAFPGHKPLYGPTGTGQHCMWDQELTARFVPGGRGEPAAIRRVRPNRLRCPTCWKAARPMCWAPWAWPPESTGSRTWPRKLAEPRGEVARAGRGLDTDDRRLAGRRAVGSGNPRRSSLAACPRGPHAPGPGLDSRCQLRNRRPSGT